MARAGGEAGRSVHGSGLDALPWLEVGDEPPARPPARAAARSAGGRPTPVRRRRGRHDPGRDDFARVGVWAVPAFAVLAGAAALRHQVVALPHAGPRGWAVILLAALTGLVGLVALARLLAGTPMAALAEGGTVAGVLGTVLVLPTVGQLSVRAPDAVPNLLSGQLAGTVAGGRPHGTVVVALALAGIVLLVAGWLLAGLAVAWSGLFNRVDGILIGIAGALLFLGGFGPRMLPGLGALLLLAAGIGVAWAGSRLAEPGPARAKAGPARAQATGADARTAGRRGMPAHRAKPAAPSVRAARQPRWTPNRRWQALLSNGKRIWPAVNRLTGGARAAAEDVRPTSPGDTAPGGASPVAAASGGVTAASPDVPTAPPGGQPPAGESE